MTTDSITSLALLQSSHSSYHSLSHNHLSAAPLSSHHFHNLQSPQQSISSPYHHPRNHHHQEQLNSITTNEEDIVAIIKRKERQRWNYGLFVIFLSIATWMVGNQIINSIIKNDSYSGQPVFISYMTGSGFAIYLVPELWTFIKYNVFFKEHDLATADDQLSSQDSTVTTGLLDATEDKNTEELPISNYELAILAIQISFIYFMNNALGSFALEFTSSSQQVILTTASSFFTLILGGIFRIESITWVKVGILFTAASGVFLITYKDLRGDGNNQILKNPILGDFLALCGSFCYACYLILIKVKIGESVQARVNERLLFGVVGLATLFTVWPLVWLTPYLPFMSPFVAPPNLTVWVVVIMNGVLIAISDYCSVVAMLLTSPLVASLSLTAAIPIGMTCDSVFYGIKNTGVPYYMGMFFVAMSLVLINVTDQTIDVAVEEALEDAILKDSALSPLLSPLLSPQFNRGIGGLEDHGFNFGRDHIQFVDDESQNRTQEILVSGGYNHKYIIRGLTRY